MEEAEKRSERLRAMRMQADQAMSSQGIGSSVGVPPSLVNPLNESSATVPSSPAAARFDYYTDPMAAFSRKGKGSHHDYHTPPRPEIATATPPYRANTYSQGPGNYHNSHISTLTQTTHPFGMSQVDSPGALRRPNAYPPGQSMFQAPEIYGGPAMGGRPMQISPFGTPTMNPPPPGVFNGSSGPPNQYCPSNISGGQNFYSPQRGGSPNYNYGRGRGQRFNDGPRPWAGGSQFQAGRGRNNNFSPASVQSHKGRSGSHNIISAEDRPDRFYDKSMVEDPWKMLKPVLWRTGNAMSKNTSIMHKYQKSSVLNSITEKKARLTDNSTKSTSEPSLAEYLAASFSETVDNESS